MKCLQSNKKIVYLSLDASEFNFIRESLREFRRVIDPRELPALTGRTKGDLDSLIDAFSEIADRLEIDL